MSKNPKEVVETLFHIRPESIKLKDNGCTGMLSFGEFEAEETAGKLVKFFQWKGCWCEFTATELKRYYRANGLWSDQWGETQILYGLAQADFIKSTGGYRWKNSSVIRVRPNGKLAITEEFILRCAGKFRTATA